VSSEGCDSASARKMIPDKGDLFNGGSRFHRASVGQDTSIRSALAAGIQSFSTYTFKIRPLPRRLWLRELTVTDGQPEHASRCANLSAEVH
jgi:hypothetical protein